MKSIKLTILILNRMINHVNWEAFPCQTGFIILPTTSSKTPTCNDESWDFGQSHPHVLQCPSVYQVPSLLPGGLWPRQCDQGGGLPASVSHRFPMFFHVFEGGLQEHLEHPLLRQVIFGDYLSTDGCLALMRDDQCREWNYHAQQIMVQVSLVIGVYGDTTFLCVLIRGITCRNRMFQQQ